MRPLYQKAAAGGFLVFMALWITGAARGLTLPYPEPLPLDLSSVSGDQVTGRQRYANNLKAINLDLKAMPLMLEQPQADQIRVHVKRAQLSAGTAKFEEDLALVRSSIASYQASVFDEVNSGTEPTRRLTLEIGVHPDKFDALVGQLRQVGRLASITVQQKDSTGEFRELHARRKALKQHQDAIIKLRGTGKNGSIDDALKLEQKVQDLEKELQTLNVQLGDLLGTESFYHVHLTLFEYQPGSQLDHTYTVPQRVLHAFFWAAAGGSPRRRIAGGVFPQYLYVVEPGILFGHRTTKLTRSPAKGERLD